MEVVDTAVEATVVAAAITAVEEAADTEAV
jgi:hypothetical protein